MHLTLLLIKMPSKQKSSQKQLDFCVMVS